MGYPVQSAADNRPEGVGGWCGQQKIRVQEYACASAIAELHVRVASTCTPELVAAPSLQYGQPCKVIYIS